jgi:ferredoxin
MFGLVTWLSYKYGRLYCNTVCPVGSLLGVMSKFSLYRIAINPQACNHCSQCVYDCKSSCIDKDNQTIDFSRCVSCFNCFTACSSNAIYYHNNLTGRVPDPTPKIKKVNLRKREFISKSVLFLTAVSGSRTLADSIRVNKNVVVTKASKIPENKQWLVLPPGSGDIKRFTDFCTACTLCVSACPTSVLQPSFLEFGLEGMMQPYMNYSSSFCNYECKICSEICPTNAIKKVVTLDEKKTIQMGKARFVKENCVVFTEHTDCGACSEHCPTKAVNMVPFEDTGLFIPKVDDTICVGCGACEYPCPVRPYKAIYVDGNPVQLVAQKPRIEKLEKSKLGADEFPF